MENQARRSELLKIAREASTSPGVYLMKDEGGAIIYVGKAKNIRNRITTYFQAQPHDIPRIEMLVGRIESFELILTETEAEALILEATLIKKNKPKFNVRLKDDKAYPYLRIQLSEKYPRIEWTRQVRRDGARYFGPFPSAWSARQVMHLLNETFLLRDCSDNTFSHRSRACILEQMKQCSGACVGKISAEEYHREIEEVIRVLEGKSNRLEVFLRKAMEEAAEKEEFEQAAQYRDHLRNLEIITEAQVAEEAGSVRANDVAAIARSETETHGVILQIRGGRLMAVKHFHIQNADSSLSDEQVLSSFLTQYYIASEQGDAIDPVEVLIDMEIGEQDLLEKTLRLEIRLGTNEFDRRLLNVAKANATYALEQILKSGKQGAHSLKAMEEVQDKLHLGCLPMRIECFDISNIQGQEAVASRVVFIDGAPEKSFYRRYKIKTVSGQNDFAMMKEVLGRRFQNDESMPDLVVVDGGKGQLSQAVAILEELGVQGVAVCGIAKARVDSDFKATEVKSSFERIFIPGRKNPISLLPHTEAYKLLVHVRDEAHRFAISYHRLLRDKKSLTE